MTEIEKLVEECAVLMRDMMGCGLHIEGKNTFCNDKRAPEEFRMACSCHEYARAVIRRTLEFAARQATGFLVGDPRNGVPLRSPVPHEIAKRLRSLSKAEEELLTNSKPNQQSP